MTREEAIKQIRNHMDVHHIGEYPHIHIKEALDVAIDALREQEKNRWIPVTERLPEEDTRVLVWVGENDCNFPIIDTDRIHKNKWVRWNNYITYWMPLPAPPEEVQK